MAPASWLQVQFTAPRAAVAAIEATLEGLGSLSVTLGDPGAEAILEPAPGTAPLWSQVVITALLPAETPEPAVRAALGALPEVADAELRFDMLAERNWVREFREQLAPRCYGSRLWICPAGSQAPAADATVVVLEPGLAFGSGSHPTTALCLQWLAARDLAGLRVLDYGCGSGILAISALALGAAAATAVDIDPQALIATADNARSNGVAERLWAIEPGDLDIAERYDIVVANILAGTLVALAPTLARHAGTGAQLALSGILSAQAPEVIRGSTPALELHLADEQSGWVLITGTPGELSSSR
jgi:ribosomal protein L11 methyltransferase